MPVTRTPSGSDSTPAEVFRRVVAACDRFEAQWAVGGPRPAVAAFVDDAPPAERSALFRRLVELEIELRRRGGESPDPDEYRRRFPGRVSQIDRAFASAAGFQAGPAPGQLTPPGDLGDYQLLGRIGSGGMGTVYRALQRSAGRVVALKLVRPELLERLRPDARDELVRRFRAEARAAAALTHDHIVTVYDVGEAAGWHYYSMRLVEGGSLAGALAGGPLPRDRAAALLAPVARAVQHAHDAGIVHRDLKPANLLLSGGRLLVADFGLAKRLDGDAASLPGSVVGTPAYMAPEQARGAEATTASDVYGLGATLYEMLTGKPPFRADDPAELFRRVTQDDPVPPRRLTPGLDRDLETVCLKCLEKDPARRYASAGELADDLVRYSAGEPIRARPPGLARRAWRKLKRTRRATVMAVALTAVAVAAVGFLMPTPDRGPPPDPAEVKVRAAVQRVTAGDVVGGLFDLAAVADGAAPADPAVRQAAAANLGAWADRLLTVSGLYAHPADVTAVAASPDGRRVAVGDAAGTVVLWDPATGAVERRLAGHSRRVSALAFSRDGSLLASGGRDSTVRVWRVADGSQPVGPIRLDYWVYAVGFTPDGRHLVVGTKSRTGGLSFWGTADGACAGRHDVRVRLFQPGPDGRRLVVVPEEGEAEVWDLAARARCGVLARPDPAGRIDSVVFSPDGRTVAAGGDRLLFWDAATLESLPTPDAARRATVAGFRPDGGAVAVRTGGALVGYDLNAGCGDPLVVARPADLTLLCPTGDRLLGVEGGRTVVRYTWPAAEPQSFPVPPDGHAVAAHFDPTGARVAVVSRRDPNRPAAAWGGRVDLWDARTGARAGDPLPPFRWPVQDLAFGPDGRRLALSVVSEGTVRVYPTAADEAPQVFAGHDRTVRVVRFRDGGRELVTGGLDGKVIGRGEDGSPRYSFACGAGVLDVRPTPDGRLLAVACTDGSVQCVRPGGPPTPLWRVPPGAKCRAVLFTPDGATVVVVREDGGVDGWRAADGEQIAALPAAEGVVGAAPVPGGVAWLTWHDDGGVRRWPHLAAADPDWHWVPNGRHRVVAVNPAAETLLTRGEDGAVQAWSVAARLPIGPPVAHNGAVLAAEWGADRSVLTRSSKSVRCWPDPGGRTLPPGAAAWLRAATGVTTDQGRVRQLTPEEWYQSGRPGS